MNKNLGFKKPKQYIPFSPPMFGKEEEKAVIDVLRSGWVTTGPKAKEFEEKIAAYVGAKNAIATSSCTSAMLVALKALEIGKGDEVIVSPYTFVSTAHVIMHCGAKPVFVDVEEETGNIDISKIEKKITKKTKAIIPVHYAGHSCRMDQIMVIAQNHNLYVIEDAAHAIGSEYKGKKIGSIGDITCFSFYATKNIATADGGMAVTNDKDLADKMRLLTIHGISDARKIWHKRYQKPGSIHYDIIDLGYKCNMTDMCAAIGICQLKKLDMFNKTRTEFSDIYDSAFKNNPALAIPVIKDYTKSNRHLYPLLLNLNHLNINRDSFIDKLKKLNIGTSILFMPLHLHSFYKNEFNYKYGDFPVAEDLFERVVCIPVSPKIGKKSIKTIASAILYLVEKYKK